MASFLAGQSNPLASPREFGSPRVARESRVVNVFEAGSKQVTAAAALPPRTGPVGVEAPPSRVPRDPRSPQTRKSLWEPLHDWTQPDDSDNFVHIAGEEAGSVSLAGHGRIKKRSNVTEIDFYSKLSQPGIESFAPQFCGSHLSNGSDWTHFVILEDVTAPYSKPALLELEVGLEHVGAGDAGSAPLLGLRINGMRMHTNDGVQHRDKVWGGTIMTEKFSDELEEYLTDSAEKLHPEVAGAVVNFLDRLEPWVAAQKGLRLVGTSILIAFEGDTTVEEPAAPDVRIVNFENVSVDSAGGADEDYLHGIRNLRWMLQRLVAYCELETAKEDTKTGRKELRDARKALADAKNKCSSAEQKCVALSPEKGSNTSATKVLHEDIIKEDVETQVQMQEDQVIAAFLKAVLAKHKINAGDDAFVELLQWRLQPLIMDKKYCSDLCDKYGLSTAATDDLLKWKETSDTRLRDLRYVYDTKLSAGQVLPSYYDLLVTQDDVQGMLMN